MKKKIKDLTFGEITELCHKNKIKCEECPFVEDEFCPLYTEERLEREVEIDESNSN